MIAEKEGLKIQINKEDIVLSVLFAISLVNTFMLIVSTVAALLYLFIKNNAAVGATKGLVFIAIRTIINPGLSLGYEPVATLKWLIILSLASIIIIFSAFKHPVYNRTFFTLLLVFFVYIIIQSLLFSGYPIVSIFKAFAWFFVFIAVIIAVVNNPEKQWVEYITNYLNSILLFSPLAIVLDIAYLRNGHAFQGITNQPNMLGIITALAFALNIHLMQRRFNFFRALMLILSVILCILSESRTGVLCITMCFMIYIWFSPISKVARIQLTFLTVLLAFATLSIGYGDSILGFMYKGRSFGDLLYSRESQINRAFLKFKQNKWFGSGFMVPFNNGYHSFSFSFDIAIEPGNIIMALLGDLGIVGLLLFSIPYGNLFYNMDRKNLLLFLTPIIASMGEMMFFSTNNIAVIYYILYAVCLVDGSKAHETAFL